MVKLYAFLVLTLATSLALAYPLTGTDVRQRDLDQEFLGREYLLDARDTYHDDGLEGRSIFSMFGALGKVGKAIKAGRQAGKLVGKAKKVNDGVNQFQPNNSKKHGIFSKINIKNLAKNIRSRLGRHHRRDLEEDEELLQRDFEDEELLEREYDDDFLVERDAFDGDLD